MTRKRLAAILLLWPLLAASQSKTPTPTGAIQGTVVDINRLPVEGVRVSVIDVNQALHGVPRQTSTDTNGHFFIGWLNWGRYRVYTAKEADGYADSFMNIQAQAEVPLAEVSQAAPTADVQIRIGPRAAVISGSITDAFTGKPVESPALRMWHWTDGVDRDSEYVFAGLSPSYRFLVPPDKEVGLEFSAPGYETWSYCGDSGGSKPFPLNLLSGAKKTIDVKLQPLPK